MTSNQEHFAVRLMLTQQVLFSIEITLIHYLGPILSIVQFGAVRAVGGVLTAMLFGRKFNIFRTEQLWLHAIRGGCALMYGWVQVLSFGQLPLADATAISYTQALYIALLSILILHSAISWRPCISALAGAV